MDYILRSLQANAEPKKSLLEFRRIQMNTLIIAELREDQALVMTQRNCKRNNLQCRAESLHGLIIGIQNEGNNAAVAVCHLPLCQVIPRGAFLPPDRKQRRRRERDARLALLQSETCRFSPQKFGGLLCSLYEINALSGKRIA